jgi:transposase, IS5 family
MIGKTEINPQLNVFRVPLINMINMKHSLVELSHKIDWNAVDKDFMVYYSGTGRPAVPVRKMTGSIFLKQLYNLTEESFISRWTENPYWQYFCGETYFQFVKPFDQSEFGHFRKRIGKDGEEKLLKFCAGLFEKEGINRRQGQNRAAEQIIEEKQFHNNSHWIRRFLAPAKRLKLILGIR